MSEQVFTTLALAWIALAIVTFVPQLFITAPYGRHRSRRWGPCIGNRAGWVVMESASLAAFAGTLFARGGPPSLPVWIFFALWVAHYINRALVFPLRTRSSGTFIPVAIVAGAICFNGINGWLNGHVLTAPWRHYTADWLTDPRFIAGLAMFLCGAGINLWADNRLIGLRKPGGTGYEIPRGGLFELVSCPNHLGEIIEWTGFALMCWNLPAAAFALWTAGNLGPRAISHHRWYRARFADYPAARRALIPFVL